MLLLDSTKHLPQNILAIRVEFIWSDICLKTHIYGPGSIKVKGLSQHEGL